MRISKEKFKRKIPLICVIISFLWVLQHSYRVSIGMPSNIRYGYSVKSFIVNSLFPAIIAIMYYLVRRRKTSFLKVYSIVMWICIAIAMISTQSLLT